VVLIYQKRRSLVVSGIISAGDLGVLAGFNVEVSYEGAHSVG